MYLVTKRIEFCYGHRLLDYDGICKHPHGHNAVVEVDVRTDRLDNRNMVADFSDIKRIVKGWIDRELDHKMILRHDDPLVAPLEALGEPIYKLESNPTVERIAKLIFDKSREQGLDVVAVRVWETPTSFAVSTSELGQLARRCLHCARNSRTGTFTRWRTRSRSRRAGRRRGSGGRAWTSRSDRRCRSRRRG